MTDDKHANGSPSDWGRIALTGVFGFGALGALHSIGGMVPSWSPNPVDALTLSLYLSALAVAWWVTLSSLVVAWSASGSVGSRLARGAARVAVPWLRGVALKGLAGSVAVGVMVASPLTAGADGIGPAPISQTIDLPEPIGSLLSRSEDHPPPDRPPAKGREAAMTASPPGPRIPRHKSAATVEVRPGDNLWDIAADHLTTRESNPTNRHIAEYWMKVIEVNLESLVSGDADVIYPGETIRLPPV